MLEIYDSLSRSKRPFVPVTPGQVGMYVCGMTVYDFCHLGHARMLVSFDVIARWLRASGLKVNYVRNITDIDDKIIKRAVQTQQKMSDVTRFYIQAMHADEAALGVLPPDHQPRATEHVQGMLHIIDLLKQKDLAYASPDGDVNFAVRRFEGYGQLSGKTLDELRSGERVAVSQSKRDPLDFVLWKASKPEEPEDTRWPSPYGWGRPGWHIECSAMSQALLGLPIDLHGGGPDLKFPHHENEIAQTQGAFGGQLAHYWMHCGPLMVDTEKMSKSLGNFKTIRQTIGASDPHSDQADYDVNPREAEMLRFFITRNHYRSIQQYTPDNLADAQHALDRLYQTLQTFQPKPCAVDWSSESAQAFKKAMDDDFNTAGAIAVLFDLASQVNRDGKVETAAQLQALGGVLGLLQTNPDVYLKSPTRYTRRAIEQAQSDLPVAAALSDSQIEALIQSRSDAKARKDFKLADQIRADLRTAGVVLEDRPGNVTHWSRG